MKKYLHFCLALLLCLGGLSGCKSKKAVIATFNDLNGEWNVIEMNGKNLDPASTHQFLVFDIARKYISGNAGCNRIMGDVQYSDTQKNIVKFPKIASTRMACPDMTEERELLSTLEKVVRFEAVGENKPITEIAFYGTDNSKLLVIKKR